MEAGLLIAAAAAALVVVVYVVFYIKKLCGGVVFTYSLYGLKNPKVAL